MLERESIDKALAEIRNEIGSYTIPEKYFANFTDAPYDQEVLREIRGGYGQDDRKVLALLMSKLRPANVLELGNYAGAASVCIYAGLPAGSSFTTVDIVEDQRYCTDEMRADSRVRFVIGDVCDPSIYGDQVPLDIDFLYEDTFHFYDHLRDIFEVYSPLLADRALIAIDDINDNDKRKYFDELPYTKWDLTKLAHDTGWGLVLFERKGLAPKKEDRLRASYIAAMNVWKRRFSQRAEALDAIIAKRPKNALRRFLHEHQGLHAKVLAVKKKLHIIPKDAPPQDVKRFYSGARSKELEHLRKNVLQGRPGEKTIYHE